jgi:hypothetical protein
MDQAAACGMDDRDETHQAASGTPEQILGSPLQGDVAFVLTRQELGALEQPAGAAMIRRRLRAIPGAFLFVCRNPSE